MSQPETNTPESVDDTRLNKRLKDMPVAIVGMASMFANSRYLNKFWDLISEKIDAITEVPDTHWRPEDYYDSDRTTPDKSYCKRGGFIPEVDFNPMEFGLPPNILELTDTSQLLSLIVAKEVLEDAKLPEGYDRDKIGITLGVGGGQKIAQSLNARLQYPVLKKVFKSSGINDEDSEMLIKKFQDQYIHWEENSFPGSLGNVISGRIANRFDLGGINCVVDAACAGSLAAMRMALSELVEGRSEMMITGGVCTDNSPTMYMSFSKTPAFTTNETIQPFDIDSKGMMIGEGIGMVALKRLEDAERDGDRIYSVIKGVGSSSDGKFKSIYAPRPEGQAKALKRAYDDAGFAPHTLGLLEAHGTGTAAGDVAEFGGLNSVFSENNEEKQHIALGSVKSQIGHTKSTAGTAGLIKAALALHHKVLPPTINVSAPNPKLDIENSPFYLNTQTRPWMKRVDGTPRRAGISSFGFGGTNFHVVLEEYTPEHARGDKYRQRQVPQTLLFSAESRQALINELKQVSTQAAHAAFKLEALAEQHALREVDAKHARIGLVVTDQADLQAQLTQAVSMLESQTKAHWQMPNGTSYRESALIAENGAGKVAALFAGQGSQYLNMGRELACHYPEMRQQLAQADQVFGQHKKTALSQILFPIPTFTPEATKAQEAVLTNTANAQSAIGTVSMGQFDIMTQAGFKADMVAGHSFGELSALCASGVISQDDYYQLAFARGDAMAATPEQGDSGTMFAVILDADKLPAVESCISQFEGVSIANYNAPTQLVIAGPTATVQQAAQALTEQGFKAIALPVSGAFHTPLVAHAQKPFAAAIDKASFSAPTLPLYSNATGKLHSKDAKAIKKAFKQHMLQSVRFSEQIEAMYEAGARVFVEFGPKNILQKLVEKTLADKNEELYAISINPSPKGDSDQQLRLAAVQLCVAGVSLDNIDPYQADIAEPAKASPMNIKLNATNYISPATRKKMDQSLASGNVTEKTEIVEVKVEVEKIVEKEVIKTEIVEVPVAAPQASNVQQSVAPAPSVQVATAAQQPQMAQPAPATIQPAAQVTVDESSLQSFFNAQQQAAEVHQQFLAIPQQYGDTFNTLMSEQAKMATAGVAIPENLQRSMEMFHQHQAETLKAHAHYLEMQAHSNNSALNMLTQGSVQTAQPTFVASVNAQPAIQAIQATPTAIVQQPVAQVQSAPVQAAPVQAQSVQVTPVQKAAPAPQVAAQAAASVAAQPVPIKAQPAPVAATVAVQSADAEKVMLEVVAEKTGYPTEMLDLEMDMEADLGIDSIKRVEILGTVQDQLPTLPELNPEDLAECRTLGEIVTYMQSKLSAAAPVATPKAESVTPIAETATAELPPHNEVALKKLPAADKLVDCFSKDACVVITDDGHNAGVLAEKLTANGIQVAVVRSALSAASPLNSEIASYTLNSVDDAGVTAVINDIEADLKTSNKVIAGFIHLQAIVDAKQSNEQAVNLNADSRASLTTAFLFAKHLNGQLNAVSGRSVFFTLSRIDGGFGYLDTKQLANAELNQAALSGLTKTLSHEWSNVFCRALDADVSIDARHLAEAITSELFDIDTNTVEIGLSHAENGESGRATLIAATPGAAQTKNTGAQLTKSDKVLVTGGAKGVTFECALTLAKQCKSHFILAGRSKHITSAELPQWAQGKQEKELKPAAIAHLQATGDKPTPKKVDALLKPVLSSLEINAALAAFNEIGASAEYLSLDVSNHESVAKTLANFDGITGLIHGAGVLADKHIQDKTLDELNMVYGTKVGGLEAVLGGLDSSKLKLIAMFSSAAGFYGNTGQSDYSMSNEILNKAALQLSARNPQAKVMSFNWGPWDGGMVNAALKRMFTERGVYVIPLQAGAELFSSQLLNETGIQLLVGTSMQGSDNKEAAVKKLNAESVHLAESPLNTSITVTRHLDPKALPFIQDHCIAGNPVLPTVCAIQWMREVTEQLLGVNVSVHNYKLLKGVIFDTDEVQELTLVLSADTKKPSSDAKSKEQLKAVISCQGRPQYQAQLQVASVQVPEDVQQASAKRFETNTSAPVTTAQALYSDGTLFHGPRLQGITSVERFDDLGLLAQCQLPQIENSDCGAFIPKQGFGDSQPFAEDYLLQAMLVWARLKYGAASLPSAIGEFVCYAPMHNGDQGWLELSVIKSTARSLQADISLYHQDGRLSAVMKGAKVTISKSLNDAFLPKSSSAVSKKEATKNAEKEQLS
ncbi:beta-ketoacyl synthase N-terminal-like domain-containing protein [Vibrio splendidus]